ncbi:5386_t:CDS:2 [Acaulospora morrowiae]|uniref:5386_t:CDS:1 n=1 Tax=Acaulospora morrowiae TaxID=94023 RepID=A0A9N9A7A9_9GLOM|nr:5386_t:CDS:2 [Acaulospora morrowiae]
MHLVGLMVPKGKKKQLWGACAHETKKVEELMEHWRYDTDESEMSDPIHDYSGTSKFGDDFRPNIGCQHDVRRKPNPQRNRRNSLDQICGMCRNINTNILPYLPESISLCESRARLLDQDVFCTSVTIMLHPFYNTNRLRSIGINRDDTLVHSSTSAIGPSKTEMGKCKSRVNQESHQVFNNVNT